MTNKCTKLYGARCAAANYCTTLEHTVCADVSTTRTITTDTERCASSKRRRAGAGVLSPQMYTKLKLAAGLRAPCSMATARTETGTTNGGNKMTLIVIWIILHGLRIIPSYFNPGCEQTVQTYEFHSSLTLAKVNEMEAIITGNDSENDGVDSTTWRRWRKGKKSDEKNIRNIPGASFVHSSSQYLLFNVHINIIFCARINVCAFKHSLVRTQHEPLMTKMCHLEEERTNVHGECCAWI